MIDNEARIKTMLKVCLGVAAIGVALVLLTGCAKDPISTNQTDNPNLPVSLLFENDGCKVYRFKDGGLYVYYTDCRGSTQSSQIRSCGKNCTSYLPVTVHTRVD